MDSEHTYGLTSRIKGKQRIKQCSYVEPACSNIAAQRIVNDHTSYMTRVRAKFEMDREIPGLGLPSHRDFTNSYTKAECGGLQWTDRAVTTCHLLLNHGALSYPKVPMHLSTMPVYKETTHTPRDYKTSKNMGNPVGTTNHHLNPSSTSTQKSLMNVEA
jgi:hypothetical protein